MTWWDAVKRIWVDTPPVINTVIDNKEYEVTESARRQAEINMKLDPIKRAAVEMLLIQQYGEQIGRAEARRRYPKAGWDE